MITEETSRYIWEHCGKHIDNYIVAIRLAGLQDMCILSLLDELSTPLMAKEMDPFVDRKGCIDKDILVYSLGGLHTEDICTTKEDKQDVRRLRVKYEKQLSLN